MPEEYGRVERFNDDELVVALPELEVVTEALAHFGVTVSQIDRSPALGLALVRGLANIKEAVGSLRADCDIDRELTFFEEERQRGHPDADNYAYLELDRLVRGIHLHLHKLSPGWKVTIGKNYLPSPVKGYPHLGGGNGDPRPTEAALGRASCGHCPNRKLGSGVRVGLLDTGIYPNEWLTGGYIARREDILNRDQASYTMFDGHCAFVASCILQEAPAAEIHVRKVLDCQGDGSAWEAAVAMAEIAQAGMDVVNLSFGEYLTDDSTAPMVFRSAVKKFSSETVVVAAAGNNGDVKSLPADRVHQGLEPNSASYPAALADVVGVGALDLGGNRAAFTPKDAPWIALLAPGVGLTGAYVRGKVNIEHKDKDRKPLDSKDVLFTGNAIWEGCSFAAGVVSGTIAARTVPGRRSARQALEELLRCDPDKPGCGIRPYIPDGRSHA
jgi:membrane-anchored mycosin MYCP